MDVFFEWLREDFWFFIRPFIYGSVGGLASIMMSYAVNESSLVSRKNKIFSSMTDEKIIDQNRKRAKRFYYKIIVIHIFIGGISGMIAVSAFNPTANELQTFSIAVIAGLSGFAFLKRSALIDDPNSDNLMRVESEGLDAIEKYSALAGEISDVYADSIDSLDNLNYETDDIDLEDEYFPSLSLDGRSATQVLEDLFRTLGDSSHRLRKLREFALDSGMSDEEILQLFIRELDEE